MLLRLAALCAAASLLSAVTAFTQSVTFSTTAYPNNNLWSSSGGPNGHAHADLNGDGREDFISINSSAFNSGCVGSFTVSLSKGDGSYASPVCYTLPSGDASKFAVGNLFNSGMMDVAVASDDSAIYIYQNDGSGSLSVVNTITTVGDVAGMTAADVNHDGSEDLVYAVNTSQMNSTLNVLFGSINGTFTSGPVTTFGLGPTSDGNQPVGGLDIGDFDDDGKVDILATTGTGAAVIENEVLYGDDKGNFTAGPLVGGGTTVYSPVSYLSDGTMSLLGAPYMQNYPGTPTSYSYLDIEQGHSNRTLTSIHVALKSCTSSNAAPAMADFNGDGINDIIVVEASDCQGSGPYTLNVLLGNSDGTFQPEQVISSSSDLIYEYHVIRASQSSKPDLVAFTGVPSGLQFTSPSELVMVNTTSGGFPACTPPNYRSEGINICSPTAVTGYTSPVTFTIGGSMRTPLRDMEIWIDGSKLAETHKNTYSYYGSITATLALHNGTHTIYAKEVGWDYSSGGTQFIVDVGNDTCKQPSNAGVNICSPNYSSTVVSPVLAYATGKVGSGTPVRMTVSVDGVQQLMTTSPTLKTNLNVRPGWHQFTYSIYNGSGQVWSASTFAVVTAAKP